MKYVYVCPDTMAGIFTGVYDAWASRVGHENVELRTSQPDNLEFFCTYIVVQEDMEKAEKVRRSIQKKLGNNIHACICYAACSNFPDKGQAIYHTLVDFFSRDGQAAGRPIASGWHPNGTGSNYFENMRNPYVKRLHEIYQRAAKEKHRYIEILRFKELENRVLFAVIEPEHDILQLLAPHFSERFPLERWIIYDKGRKKAIGHEPQKGCSILSGVTIPEDYQELCADVQADFERLWAGFCEHVSIKDRENKRLQRQMAPLKYRKYMEEFQKRKG